MAEGRRARRGLLRFAILITCLSAATWAGCGSEAGPDDASPILGEMTITPPFGDASPDACTGIACMRVNCGEDAGTTSLSGTVVSPRPGDPDPIYNALVYVPNATVEPFTEGVSCDRCGAVVSGNPISIALTGVDGKFVLTDVPVVADLPVVIQLGRWRRQIKVSTVTACANTPLTADQTRLPRNRTEGDIPKMALKTGDSDSPECVLRKMGIDDSEFTAPNGGGRIEVYRGILANPPVLNGGSPPASAFLDDLNRMKRYDLVLLPCDGSGFTPTDTTMQNLEAYAGLGGRIFASHFSYEFIRRAPAPSKWPDVVDWNPTPTIPPADAAIPGYIDTSFPKGKAMSDWLQNLGAANGGVISTLWQPRRDVNDINGDTLAWIRTKAPDPVHIEHFSFNTPVGVDAGAQCGRIVFNDFHTVNVFGGQTGIFPSECSNRAAPLTPQERVFEFMLFDLSSCVQKDDLPPVPPPPVN